MTLRRQTRATRSGYGGQAVIEGVMIRGPRHATVVCRQPDGRLAIRTKTLRRTYTGWAPRLPFLRGVLVLAETLHLGVWALMFSQNVALAEEGDAEPDDSVGVAAAVTMLVAFTFAIAVFFLGPIWAARWLEGRVEPDILAVVFEGFLRLALLIGYLGLIGRLPDIRRVFQYHGAEHKTIAAWEAGAPLTIAAVRPFSRAHPRCGTSFLLVVAVIAIILFTALGNPPLWWHITSRIVLIPVVAAVAYEAIRLGGRYRHVRLVGWLFAPNLWLQALTTREPDDTEIGVAISAMEHALEQDGALERAPAEPRGPLAPESAAD